jgi:hypothetical protein
VTANDKEGSASAFFRVEETDQANVGPLEVSITDMDRVNVPVWVGVASTVVGAGRLLGLT